MGTYSLDLCGRNFSLETGEIARQASGAVLVRYGNSAVLVTATMSDEPREGVDFFPLTVDYEERLYAVGRIPGGFIKREGRPTEKAILAARLTDRPLRPLFPKKFRNAVHIVATVLAVDQDCSTEIMAVTGASAALSISKIPFDGPVAAVVVGLIDGEPVINPTVEQMKKSNLNLIVAGTEDAIMMVEAGADEVPEEKIIQAIFAGHEEIKRLVLLQKEMVQQEGVPKVEVPVEKPDLSLKQDAINFIDEPLDRALRIKEKQAREKELGDLKKQMLEELIEKYPEQEMELSEVFEEHVKRKMRDMILHENIRVDGRKPSEIRPVSCKVRLFERTHGSALFTRGQTQVLNVCTLGALRDVQVLDGLGIEETKRFMHHYNFPPYSVGEAGFMRGPGRREIGHGALAERALEPMIPDEDEFPYTIRLVSEVVESNGSTSMGSVCAGTLSLMDAGVPIKKPVAGVAMGLMKEEESTVILTDIQGIEDFLGDMDFKVAGTVDGITALQMDIKIKGLDRNILEQALAEAKKGYLFILEKMLSTIDAPRPELSPFAPRIITMQISVDKIRDVIGPGGKMVNKIIAETGVEIDIQPDGKIYIAALDSEAGEKAKKMIESLTADVEPGKIYLGRITRTEKYGAFAEVLPGKEGLIHISELDHRRVERTEDVVKVGDEVLLKVTDIDEKGRINLSRKDVLPPPENGEQGAGGYNKEKRRRPAERKHKP